MAKQFQSAAEAAAFLADDNSMESLVREEILRNSMVTALMNLRVEKGLKQKDVAARMGCDPSKISKLESDNDMSLRWQDVVGYLSAMNVRMSILLEDEDLPASDRIKHSVFRIHDALQSLVELARQVGEEDEIADKIHQFYGEVLFNFLTRFEDSYQQLRAIIHVPELEPTSSTAEPPKPGKRMPATASR